MDDSRRYVERVVAASVYAWVDMCVGMPHRFAGSIAKLTAAAQALHIIGAFLAERLQARRAGFTFMVNEGLDLMRVADKFYLWDGKFLGEGTIFTTRSEP